MIDIDVYDYVMIAAFQIETKHVRILFKIS